MSNQDSKYGCGGGGGQLLGSESKRGWVQRVGGVLGTCVAWSLSGTIPPLIYATAPPEQAGQVVGLLHLLWSLAMLTGTLLAGGLAALNPALPFWTAALINLPAVAAALSLARTLRAGSEK